MTDVRFSRERTDPASSYLSEQPETQMFDDDTLYLAGDPALLVLGPRWTPKSGQYDQLVILAGFDPSTEVLGRPLDSRALALRRARAVLCQARLTRRLPRPGSERVARFANRPTD